MYVDDDRAAASVFVSGINRKILRLRFSEGSKWEPDHITLALFDDKPVAMADAVILGDGKAANAGLLAKPGFGGYALKALLHLRNRLDIPHWEATLRFPTDAIIAISRRYFTRTYDQATSELASKLAEMYGQQNYLHPIPLVASHEFLKTVGLPLLRAWDRGTRLQVLKAAALSGGLSLQTPSGHVLPMQDIMALAFDLLETPYDVRQQFSRAMISTMAAMHGHDPSPLIGRILKPGSGTQFMSAVREFAGADISAGGKFTVEYADPAQLQEVLRQVSGRYGV